MVTFLVILAVLGIAAFGLWRYVQGLSGDQKAQIKGRVNRFWIDAERKGWYPRAPAFITDYDDDYPWFREFEKHYDVVREECESLIGIRDQLTDVEALGGGYTEGGIHAIQWKSFMFKQGEFIEENCRLAPKTTELLRKIPNCYTAFFSILEPDQYVVPHFGYYKGFLRYHLGVRIPKNNEDHACWLRINADPEDNRIREKHLATKGDKYYWKNGEGVLFDDTYLHDAANESDEVRVVLWLDIARKLPWYLHAFNKLCLWIVHKDGSIKKIRRNATLNIET